MWTKMAEEMSTEYAESTPAFSESEVLVFRDQSGNSYEVYNHSHELIPLKLVRKGAIADPRKHLPKLRQMQIRPDDVLICAYPKAGTHWVWEIVRMLQKKSAEYEDTVKEKTMIEFRDTDFLDKLPSPRALNTHLHFRSIPRQVIDKQCKLIFIQRNPKDIAVSFYHHMVKMCDYKGTWADFMPMFLEGKVIHAGWTKYTKEWEQEISKNPDLPILNIYFEDLKQNPKEQVKRISEFLSLPCDQSLLEAIVDKCNFSTMKEGKMQLSTIMYRKGVVGDWKNWLTVAQNEKFDSYLETNMKKLYLQI